MVDVVPVAPQDFAPGARRGPAAMLERVRAACADQDHQDPLDEAARLRLRHHGLEGSRLWLVSDSGFALVRHGEGSAELELAVAPSARQCGFGGALLATALDGLDLPVSAWSHGDHPAAATLAVRHGFEAARELWVMRRGGDPVPAPVLPDGVEVRSFAAGDEAELLRVNAAAFADHPEQGALDEAGLRERMAEPWFDAAGLLLAVEGDRLLGFHWTKVHPDGAGEVYVVGVDPAAQGRGLGRVLTLAGLRHLAEVGVPEVHLYVERDNAAARALYEGIGFRHDAADTHVQYLRS
jgi:mycothiol synthase